jgi:hypothetical protein
MLFFCVVRMLLCWWKMVHLDCQLLWFSPLLCSFPQCLFSQLLDVWLGGKKSVVSFVLWGTCESECKVMYLVMFLRCFLEDGCTVTQPAATCLKLQQFQELLVVWFSHMIWEASLWEMQPYHLLPKLGLWLLPLQMLLLSSKERYVPSWCSSNNSVQAIISLSPALCSVDRFIIHFDLLQQI